METPFEENKKAQEIFLSILEVCEISTEIDRMENKNTVYRNEDGFWVICIGENGNIYYSYFRVIEIIQHTFNVYISEIEELIKKVAKETMGIKNPKPIYRSDFQSTNWILIKKGDSDESIDAQVSMSEALEHYAKIDKIGKKLADIIKPRLEPLLEEGKFKEATDMLHKFYKPSKYETDGDVIFPEYITILNDINKRWATPPSRFQKN